MTDEQSRFYYMLLDDNHAALEEAKSVSYEEYESMLAEFHDIAMSEPGED